MLINKKLNLQNLLAHLRIKIISYISMNYLCRKFYYYPLEGVEKSHVLVYTFIIRFQDSCFIKKVRKRLIQDYIHQTDEIPAYQALYTGIRDKRLECLPVTNKQNFHLDFKDVIDRLPKYLTLEQFKSLHILTTSGSTSGKSVSIPISPNDSACIQNYYRLLGKITEDIFPDNYKHINMFPASDSSTSVFSDLLVPRNFRLGQSNADSKQTIKIMTESFEDQKLTENTDLVLSGLPISHLNFINYLLKSDNCDRLITYIKKKGICLYGGESLTIQEKLYFYKYYNKVVGIYGSTELGPKLGFSIDANLIMDIALLIPEVLQKINLSFHSVPPITFFYDKYLNNYEVINHSLINTPFIQQTELKIKWDQEDYCEIIDPHIIIDALKYYSGKIFIELDKLDTQFGTNLRHICSNLIYGTKYNKLIHYFGIICFYGRQGILYGGVNLDNKFVENIFHIFNERYNQPLNYLALYKLPSKEIEINNPHELDEHNYSGLRLDILVEINNENQISFDKLKKTLIEIMKEQHPDFNKILHFYEEKQIDVTKNIHLWIYHETRSPMHKRFMSSNKRNYIIKGVDFEHDNKPDIYF
jgi:hypothetical protein